MINDQHILLIGFKNVGKSTIGKLLAEQINKPFYDLDQAIEAYYQIESHNTILCRDIMHQHGQTYFRDLEHRVFKQLITQHSAVISLGGGTPIDERNHTLITSQTVIQITAPMDLVYDRIIKNGLPAFFDEEQNPSENFSRLWNERHPVYEKLAHFSVENNSTPDYVVNDLIEKVKLR